ncbi:gluconate permease, partial [Mammaliicoccus sciuri]
MFLFLHFFPISFFLFFLSPFYPSSFFLALSLQIPPDKIADSIEKGLGDTLGHIGLIFGLGAMLGKL